jgi:predicted glutamine amidotransferase
VASIRQAGRSGQLNVIAGDGRQLVGVRFAVGKAAPSLYHRVSEGRGFDVASEPLSEDTAWTRMAESTLVVAARDAAGRVEVAQHALTNLTD